MAEGFDRNIFRKLKFMVFGLKNQSIGDTLDSTATTVTITHPIHHVSGVGAIATMNPPWVGFSGSVTLIPADTSTVNTAGNVAKAVSHVANQAAIYVYNPSTAKWYPIKN